MLLWFFSRFAITASLRFQARSSVRGGFAGVATAAPTSAEPAGT